MSRHISAFTRLGMVSTVALVVMLLAVTFSKELFYSGLFDLHGECYRWIPSLVALHVVSDTAIWLSYMFISSILFISIRQLRLPFQTIFIAFGAFIICCGMTHLLEVVTTLLTPIYWFAGFVKLVTAIVSIWTAIILPPFIPKVRIMLADVERAQEQGREIAALYEKYITLADVMPLLVWVGNAQGEFEFFNAMWKSYTGYSTGELFEEAQKGAFVYPDDFQHIRDYWVDQRPQGIPFEAEVRLRRYDGAFLWHIVHIIPLHEEDGTIRGWVSTATDIDKQKRNEQALQETQQRQDTFLTMTSHELKTPLTSMQLLISFFRRELTDVKYDKALSTIENQLNRIVRLVNDLLDMSKIKAGQLSFAFMSCDVSEIAHEAVARMQMSTSTHQLVLVCDTTALVQADPGRLEQIIVNLLTNAIKYSPEADRVDINITSDEHNVLFSVRDYGIGISQKAQAHVFEQYYRSIEASHQKYPGLGIGLYITSEIVKHHNGVIWIDSEEGKGSTFSFSLPLKKEDRVSEALS